MRVDPGMLLAGRYRLTDQIAVGGMGEVWRGTDELLGRTVAVKVLKPEYADDQDFLDRFRAEARHTAALSHAGIASIFDYGEDHGTAYLVMELVEGQPLSKILARGGALGPAQTMDIVGQTALALQAAHDAGVIHRDVKPGNLIVADLGDGELRVKVTDFGIARAADAVPLTRTGTVLGTAFYLSPEQASGRPITPASDVYSLGVVGYECLTGTRPFPGPNPLTVAIAHQTEPPPPLPRSVPAPVRDLLSQALAKDVADRPSSAGVFGRQALALRDALRAGDVPTVAVPIARRDEPTHTQMLPPVPPPVTVRRYEEEAYVAPPPRDQRWVWVLIIVALIIAAAIAGVLLTRGTGGPVSPTPTPSAPTTPTPSPTASASPTPHSVTVPSVVNLPVAEAEGQLTAANLTYTTRNDPQSDQPAGTVTDQSPGANKSVDPGTSVTLTVSARPATVSIKAQDYVGHPVDEVRSALEKLGFTVQSRDNGGGAPPGTVTDVQPTGAVARGATVTVTYVAQSSPSPSAQPSSTSPSALPSSSPTASAPTASGGGAGGASGGPGA